VSQRPGEAAVGLRELKKQRTRETLVDVAARLCAEQGYERTTVDQIASVAEVSPRTFSRYFHNKEAVIAALMEEISEEVAQALTAQPHDITEHEALVRAHTQVLRAAEVGQPQAMSFHRMRGFLSIVTSTPMLSLATFTFRPDGSTHAVVEAIAGRMGLPVADPAVRVVFDTWAVLMATALGSPASDASDPGAVSNRIEETFAIFTRLWQPWRLQDQTPAGEPGQQRLPSPRTHK
jgi:AcrR family transcriptional regulator